MWGSVVLYSAVFALYSAMEVLGLMPQEIISAGLTLPGLLAGYYGDPSVDFVRHHLRRTTVAIVIHLALPLLYCTGLGLVVPQTNMLNVWEWSSVTMVMWLLGSAPLMCGLCIALYWSRAGWKQHPLAIQLSLTGQPWRGVASSVNSEFRDIDKFISTLGGSVVVVTDSWLIQTNVHSVDIIHQRDAVLNVSSADEHRLTLDGQSAQYLTIHVNSINTKFKSFAIRLNSMQYSQLTEKIQAPIRTARSVLIQHSLSERFAAAFSEQVERNGVYHLPPGSPPLEACVGCLQQRPQVKLHKMCDSAEGAGGCRLCYCRPMWCMACMSKWFAARQDQHRPETWLSSSAPCPMCRAQFCMLDVLKLEGA